MAEDAFKRDDYDAALKLYNDIKKLEPEYANIDILIGDVYYCKKDYAQAKESFEKVIQKNFISYQAHWFLADAEWEIGEKEKALMEITIAHLLSVNNPRLREKLGIYREKINRPWKKWAFNPQYKLSLEENTIKVNTQPDWLGYALVKALWRYEPGYAEQMFGSNYKDQVVCFMEEKEALLALLAQNESFKEIGKVDTYH